MSEMATTVCIGWIGILFAALPTANTVFVLAEQFDTYSVRSSATILVTTLVSIATLSALVYVLQ